MKTTRVYDKLCATCYQKLNLMYRLKETPTKYREAGYGKCDLCDFTGALSAYWYDPAQDKRTLQEMAQMKEKVAPPKATRPTAIPPQQNTHAFAPKAFPNLDRYLDNL